MRRRVMVAVVAVISLLALQIGGPQSAAAADFAPTVGSEYADYNPGQTVVLNGSGWDPAGGAVMLVVNDDVGQAWGYTGTAVPDAAGVITHSFSLPTFFVAEYAVRATQTGADGNPLQAAGSFTDANPSASLDQCGNDPAPSPNTDGCSAAAGDWINGNLGASKAVYLEGDSIPYRMSFDNLSLAPHTVTLEWDTTKSGAHALDYLTSYNRTVATANPCLGVAGCGTSSTFPIPVDPQVTAAGVIPVSGDFTLFGGTITAASAYSYADGSGFTGDRTARITLTFTATRANPVLAWGGHISSRADWGLTKSAVAIPGSPYHTRLIGLDGAGGNQDRSLSADAVIFPGSITVIKDAAPNGPTPFTFTAAPAPLSGFTLVDDGTSAGTKVFGSLTSFVTYTVAESAVPTGWSFTGVTCTVTSANGGTVTTTGASAAIALAEGENRTCTFTNTRQTGTLVVRKHVVNDNGGTATADQWALHVADGGADVAGSPAAGSETGTSYLLPTGDYVVSESGGPAGYDLTGFSGGCGATGAVTVVSGQTVVCTLTNDDRTAHLRLVKEVVNDNGGTAVAADVTVTATGPTPISGAGEAESDVDAGGYTLSESALAGYDPAGWSCAGGTFDGTDVVVLASGESAVCTVINDDRTAHLTLVKQVVNDNGGTATATDFTLSAAGPTPLSGAGGVDGDASAGTYTLSESDVAGYAAGSWVCDGGTFTPPRTVVLHNGEAATCTVTNDDIAPRLHLRKVVVNDNGGTATSSAFTLSADGTGTNDLAGTTPVDSGTTLRADTWTLAETQVNGYTAGPWNCIGGTQSGSAITLGIGEEATCTITNDDRPGTIVVSKLVRGTITTSSFSFATTGSGYPSFSLGGGQSSTQTLNAGTYTVRELVPLGWVLTGIGGSTDPYTPYNCTVSGSGGSSGVGDLNTQTATISLRIGDTVNCVFENTGQGVTRTQGFWSTHPQLANVAWFGGTAFGHTFPGVAAVPAIGDRLICGRSVDTLGKVTGAFWSDVAKTTTGTKRSALDQARMQLLQQLVAAELNASAFGSVPSTGSFAQWESALCGTNQTAIKNAQQQAASFNSAGDSAAFTPGTSADSKTARAIANLAFWNTFG